MRNVNHHSSWRTGTIHRTTIVLLACLFFAFLCSGISIYLTFNYNPRILNAVLPVSVVVWLALIAYLFCRHQSVSFPVFWLASIVLCAILGLIGVMTDFDELTVVALFISILLLLLLIGYAIIAFCTAWWRRRAVQRVVIGQIASMLRQNLPLATGLALAADSERGQIRTHLHRIARLLAQGLSLAQAVERGFPGCDSLIRSLIIAGERVGQLPAALEQAENMLIERDRRRSSLNDDAWLYALVILIFAVLIVSGLMVAIVPKFMEIFKDFDLPLPPVTVTLISVSEWCADFILLLVPLIVLLPLGLYLSFRPRRLPDPSLISRLADRIRWYTPGLHRMIFGRDMAAVLRYLRLAVRSGMTLDAGARLAAGLDVNCQLRPRVVRFADLLQGGTNIRQAAVQAGLGEVTGIALAGGQRDGRLDAALRFAGDYYDALVSRWYIVARAMSWPVCTLGLACLVAFVALAMFQPLVALIDSCCSAWGAP